MSQPDLTTTKFIVRCMGGDKCNHTAGTCTATQGDVPILPDWVLIEAANRGGFSWKDQSIRQLHDAYAEVDVPVFNALCDMIAKHEQKPVDRKLLCAREAIAGSFISGPDCVIRISVRAIELWEEGFGK
jgi:hypothetical protein